MILLPSRILTPRGETGEPESFRVRAGSNSARSPLVPLASLKEMFVLNLQIPGMAEIPSLRSRHGTLFIYPLLPHPALFIALRSTLPYIPGRNSRSSPKLSSDHEGNIKQLAFYWTSFSCIVPHPYVLSWQIETGLGR